MTIDRQARNGVARAGDGAPVARKPFWVPLIIRQRADIDFSRKTPNRPAGPSETNEIQNRKSADYEWAQLGRPWVRSDRPWVLRGNSCAKPVCFAGITPRVKNLIAVLSLFLVLAVVSPASAWSGKEHIQFTRIAMERILADPTAPQSLKDWIKQVLQNPKTMKEEETFFMASKVGNTDGKEFGGIEYWIVAPDVHAQKDPKGTIIEGFGVAELPMHFIDLELFVQGDKPRTYKHDLSSKPKLEDIPHDKSDPRFIQAGMLPFSIEWAYKNFVDAVKAGRLMPADPKSTDLADNNALRWGRVSAALRRGQHAATACDDRLQE